MKSRLRIILKSAKDFLKFYEGKKLTPKVSRYVRLYILSTYKEAQREKELEFFSSRGLKKE